MTSRRRRAPHQDGWEIGNHAVGSAFESLSRRDDYMELDDEQTGYVVRARPLGEHHFNGPVTRWVTLADSPSEAAEKVRPFLSHLHELDTIPPAPLPPESLR